jgi:DNA-binding PadR family transcriptional regulator
MDISKLVIEEPPIMVLPNLAAKIGLNEAIVLQQLYWLLRNPQNGKRIANHQWIFNTVEQWVVSYFPFWSPKTVIRTFQRLEELQLVECCQPEGRVSRRKYYRINTSGLKNVRDLVKLAKSNRANCPNGNRSKWPVPITETTTKNSLQRKGKGASLSRSASCSFFKPRYEYPRTEDEMYDRLEASGIEPNPDYDGQFYDSMIRNNWSINGEPVFDWIATYESRVAKIDEDISG